MVAISIYGVPTVHERLNRINSFITIKLMQVQFEITFKALWHLMNGGHLESMGCQLL